MGHFVLLFLTGTIENTFLEKKLPFAQFSIKSCTELSNQL